LKPFSFTLPFTKFDNDFFSQKNKFSAIT
jgi:hypothetical protein